MKFSAQIYFTLDFLGLYQQMGGNHSLLALQDGEVTIIVQAIVDVMSLG